jgi:membrane associated rhomboid family serine protease
MFMHGGWVHIGSNMLFLWVFGDNVEDTLGHIQYLLFYLFCGIAASLMQFFIDPSSTIPMIGASGAIAGVLGAYWHLYPHSSIKSLVPIGFFITLLNIPASIMIGLWFVTQLLSGYASIATSSSSGDVGGIAFWAHVGGFIAGLLLIRIFPKRKRTFWRVD